MKTVLISVIVPNYNNEQYISQCLESILSQTHDTIEVVVVDDHSTDNSLSIIEKFIREHPDRIKLHTNTRNEGVAVARNTGINLAIGEYITTLDSDDYYIDNTKLEKELSVVLGITREEGIAFSGIVAVDQNGHHLCDVLQTDNMKEGYIFEDLLTRKIPVPRDFLFTKKQYLSVGGFDSHIEIYEDWDFKLRLAVRYPFFYSQSKGTAYRQHGVGLSSVSIKHHIKWLNYVFKKNLHQSKKKNISKIFFLKKIMYLKLGEIYNGIIKLKQHRKVKI